MGTWDIKKPLGWVVRGRENADVRETAPSARSPYLHRLFNATRVGTDRRAVRVLSSRQRSRTAKKLPCQRYEDWRVMRNLGAEASPGGVPSVADCETHRPYFATATKGILRLRFTPAKDGGGRRIRTTEGLPQQIYSLPPLATWVSHRNFKEG